MTIPNLDHPEVLAAADELTRYIADFVGEQVQEEIENRIEVLAYAIQKSEGAKPQPNTTQRKALATLRIDITTKRLVEKIEALQHTILKAEIKPSESVAFRDLVTQSKVFTDEMSRYPAIPALTRLNQLVSMVIVATNLELPHVLTALFSEIEAQLDIVQEVYSRTYLTFFEEQ